MVRGRKFLGFFPERNPVSTPLTHLLDRDPLPQQQTTATACSTTTAHSTSPVATDRASEEGSPATEAAAEAATLSSLCCKGTTQGERARALADAKEEEEEGDK